jgi:hypothetical protein
MSEERAHIMNEWIKNGWMICLERDKVMIYLKSVVCADRQL